MNAVLNLQGNLHIVSTIGAACVVHNVLHMSVAKTVCMVLQPSYNCLNSC